MSDHPFFLEEKLIEALRKKDPKALEYLYDAYSAALYGVAIKIVQNNTYADEVLQDSFMNIWQKFDSYESNKSKLFTWMMNIVRNKAIDKVRSAEVRKENKSDSMSLVVSVNNIGGTYEQKTDTIGLQEVLEQLDEKSRFVLEKIYYEGYTHSELSKAFDMPLGTVKTRLRNAINILRQKLG